MGLKLSLAVVFAMLGAVLAAEPALPFDVGGPFVLTDQTGAERTEADPDGRHQLLFFGYANCEQICSAALPMMADIVDDLADVADIRPVMITVDPARDTIADIGPALVKHHPQFVGLTGTPEQLQVAYDAYSVEVTLLFEDTLVGDIFSHGSFLYLLDGDGKVLTLLPPVLATDQATQIVQSYLNKTG